MANDNDTTPSGIPGTNSTPPKKSSSDVQKPLLAIGAGFGAMVVSIVLWILIAQKLQMLWVSVVLAYGIATTIRYSGNITDKRIGLISALFSFITTLCGNMATTIFILTKVYGKSPLELFGKLNIGQVALESFRSPVGVLFYLGALFVGLWFAYKHPPKLVRIE
jgi:hypothetical protein